MEGGGYWPNPRQGGALWPQGMTFYWTIDSYHPGTREEWVPRTIQEALNGWATCTHFTFVPATPGGPAPNLHIGWYQGEHTDYWGRPCFEPFNGSVWFGEDTLGHSKYVRVYAAIFDPFHVANVRNYRMCSVSDFSGRIHLYQQNEFGYYKVKSIILHEMGHVLGLDHSPVKGSAMYATEPIFRSTTELDTDDVNAIHSLYPY